MTLESIKRVNLALRFILELCTLVSLGYWGFHQGSKVSIRIGIGLGAPILAAGVWGVFGAPNSSTALHGVSFLILEILWFGAAAAALFGMGQRTWAVGFSVVFVVNRLLMYLWNQ